MAFDEGHDHREQRQAQGHHQLAGVFRTFYPASCSYSGAAKGKVPIVSGTGTYAGIKGTLTATVIEAEQASLLKNGKCNTSDAAPLLAADLIATATGKVSF